MNKKKIRRIMVIILSFILLLKLSSGLNIGNKLGFSKTNKALIMAEQYRLIEDIASQNAIVIDRDIGEILMGKAYDEKIHPASMNKVMTAIIGLENVSDLNDRTKIRQEIVDYCISNGLSVSGFELGDSPKIIDLLYGIILESGGESSITLANYVAGSEEEFVKLMNEKAGKLNMTNTNFGNSTGITSSENYSTVEDMGILFDYALNNKKFKKIAETNEYVAKGLRGPFTRHEIKNQLFFKRNSLDINKEYIKCGKTGYTDAAGLCLVSLGEINNKEYIVVVAGSYGSPQTEQYNLTDTNKIYEKLKE